MKADIVLTNGRIYPLDGVRRFYRAAAVAAGKILALGENEAMVELLGDSGEQVDLGDRTVTAGLVDAHVHFQWYSLSLQQVRLMDTATLEEAMSRVAEKVDDTSMGEWLIGRGWNQADWAEGRFPTAADLDRVAPNRPLLMIHRSGHAAWANSLAMRRAGIRSDTEDPEGGQIQRDEHGQPTGIFFESAIDLVRAQVPKPSEEQLIAAMVEAQQLCLQAGLTGFHDFDPASCFRALQTMRNRGELALRVVKNIPVRNLDSAIELGLRTGFGDEWLQIGGIKIFADGALGPRTAAMLAPYEGEPGNRGIVVTDKEEMMALASKASASGLTLTVHAIGDRANHDVLDVYEAIRGEEQARAASASGEVSPSARTRHRIEHVQVLHPDDLGRLARLDILASMQPVHATSDMEMADRHWGERSRYSYAWRDLLNQGAVLVFGSDAPVESIEPLTGIHAAVTRRRADGKPGLDGWRPEQKLTIEESIRAYTLGPAIASYREKRMGTIAPGMLADLTIFDRDIFATPGDELLGVTVGGVMIDGQFAHRTF